MLYLMWMKLASLWYWDVSTNPTSPAFTGVYITSICEHLNIPLNIYGKLWKL